MNIDIRNSAVEAGKYTVTITPKATTSSSKLTGKTTAELSIFATDINTAVFKMSTDAKETTVPVVLVKKILTILIALRNTIPEETSYIYNWWNWCSNG